MRRTNLVLAGVIIALLAVPLAVMASSNENYLDRFENVGYDGSDGSIFWEPHWTEIGDIGNPTSGSVRVANNTGCASGNCLNLLGNVGAQRQADTSQLTGAILSYRVEARCAATCILGLLGTFHTEVRTASGTWEEKASPSVADLAGGEQVELDLSDSKYESENFAVKFRITGLSVGTTVYIDDVEIEGEIEVPTTTTTTTTSTTVPSITVPSITVPSITTSTTRPTTTTTPADRPTTTTTPGTATTTSVSHETPTSEDRDPTTSTTEATTTTTTSDDDGSVVALGPDEPPADGGDGDGGLRQATRGIQAGLHGSMFADVNLVPMFDPVDVDFNFGLFAEEIETSWLWMTLFGLVLTWALVSDLDRRRFKRHPPRVSAPAES